jgi:hypothetical protein
MRTTNISRFPKHLVYWVIWSPRFVPLLLDDGLLFTEFLLDHRFTSTFQVNLISDSFDAILSREKLKLLDVLPFSAYPNVTA